MVGQKYDGEILIKTSIEPDADISDFERATRNIGDNFDDAKDKSIGFSDILTGNILSDVVMAGLAKLADLTKEIAGQMIEAAAAVKAETSQFEQTFGDQQEAAREAIGRVAENAGVLETRMTTLGAQLYAFARASGGDTAESLGLMETALQAAADSAAYYDRSLEDSVGTLQSFLKGNFENDAALGLSATETTRNAAAMELFGEKYADLTEIQKQQTLLKMVTDAQALSGALGQAARESESLENSQGNLKEAWRQIMADVGEPFLEKLVPIIQQTSDMLVEWSEGIDWDAFSENVKETIDSLLIVFDWLFKNREEIKSVLSGDFIADAIADPIIAAIENIQTLLEPGGVKKFFEEVWASIKEPFSGAIEFFEDLGERIIDGLFGGMKNKEKSGGIGKWISNLFGGSSGGGYGHSAGSFSLGTVPALASGAVIPPNRAFLAVLGDQHSGTNVEAPLSTIEQAVENVLARRGGAGGGEMTLNISALPGFARYLKFELDAESTRQGGRLVNIERVYT